MSDAQESLPTLPAPGDVVDGKYRIEGILGRGGMGVVFEAVHQRLHQRVALKMLHPFLKDEPGVIERFEREARAAGQLVSPNIARVLDVETSPQGIPYIVMELLEGHDLEEELETLRQFPIADAVDYVIQACAAIREAHAVGVIHRDLKPANLFMCASPDGPMIKILDFGISKITTEVDGRLTAAMTTLGSPIYMSPEQLRGASTVDARTDIWSLGIVLYELIAGEPPYDGSVTAVTASIVADTPPPIARWRAGVPAELEAVIAKALRKSPDERYADAEEFAEALVPFGHPTSSKWLEVRTSLVPVPPSSRRLSKMTPAESAKVTEAYGVTMKMDAQPGPPPSDTRHAFTTQPVPVESPRGKRTFALGVAGALAVAGVVGLVFFLRAPHPSPSPATAAPLAEPAQSSGPVVATPSAEPASSTSAAPPATAKAPSVSSSASNARTVVPPRPRAAPTANPLRL